MGAGPEVVTALLWLVHRLGNFGGAAALIGSSERTVREKYGADESAGVAAEARADSHQAYG